MTSDKINLLINTKNKIRQALIECGIEIDSNTPFSKYADYIKELSNIEASTDTSDLMEIVDFNQKFNKGKYEGISYTEKEQQELLNLTNLIINGEEI